MLLSNNNEKIIKFISYFDKLSNVDKLRVCIHILESKYINFKNKSVITLMKKELNILDDTKNTIINFNKYQNLTSLVSKFMKFNDSDKLNIIIEMLFNVYETDFNKSINEEINLSLPIYDLAYKLLKS